MYNRRSIVASDLCGRCCVVVTATNVSQTSALLLRMLLEKELESMGIRLNRKAPNIYFKVCCSLLLFDL